MTRLSALLTNLSYRIPRYTARAQPPTSCGERRKITNRARAAGSAERVNVFYRPSKYG